MDDFRFKKFPVYKDSKNLYHLTCLYTKEFSSDYKHLKEQLRRAALSVVLNIAEGSGQQTDKNFGRYISNALGSVNELAAGFDIAFDEALITEKQFKEIINLSIVVRKQLGGLSKKLQN